MNVTEIKVYRDLTGENDRWAGEIRELLANHGVRMLNLIGSPGSGKTTLLERMTRPLSGNISMAVLEGDIETTRDAQRLHALGVPVSQLLSGGACHLEARMVYKALCDFDLTGIDLVIVENVGNMVCPAEFDIGEAAKIAVLSVTEGEDKPLKYPLLYREAAAVVITKTDLLPHLETDLAAYLEHLREVNAGLPAFTVSAVSGENLDSWVSWVIDMV